MRQTPRPIPYEPDGHPRRGRSVAQCECAYCLEIRKRSREWARRDRRARGVPRSTRRKARVIPYEPDGHGRSGAVTDCECAYCLECRKRAREWARQYRAKNGGPGRKYSREYMRKWRDRNREHLNQYHRDRYHKKKGEVAKMADAALRKNPKLAKRLKEAS